MPQKGNVHIDAALSNLAIRYKNLAFVAPLLMPYVNVIKESDKYYKFSREELREVDTHRAVGAPSNEWDWDVTNETYSCVEYALKHLVPDRIVNNSDSPIKPKMTSQDKLLKVIHLGYEKRVRDLLTGGTLTSAAPTVKWDGTSPTMEADIDTGKKSIRDNAGVEPNILCMNDQVKDYFKRDSTIRNLIRYTINGSAGQELLVNGELPPVIFNLKVVIAQAREDTAKKGQTASMSIIWPDDVLIAYSDPTGGIQALSLGYTFRVPSGTMTKTWRDEARDGVFIEPRILQDEKIVASQCGYLIDNVLG